MTKIVVHCLVKNEENFIWYSLQSVLPFVDRIMVWDTGSTDRTLEIIRNLKSKKIELKEYGSVTSDSFTHARQAMLDATSREYTWLMILDGDEVWSNKSIKTATNFVRKNSSCESVVVQTHNLIGDIYHRLPDSKGQYKLAGRVGHLALRFMNLKKIKGLHVDLPHGQIGYFDADKKLIQDRDPALITYLPVHYAHATHLRRSGQDKLTLKRGFKYKYDQGEKIRNTDIPEVFFSKDIPPQIPRVIKKASMQYWIISQILAPIKTIKQIIMPVRSGY